METEDAASSIAPFAFGAASSDRGLVRRKWSRGLSRIVSATHVISLADQAVVSGTSFLTMVLVARASDPSELGVYALGISILTILIWVQDSLVLTPYTVQRHQPHGTQAEQAGSALTLSALLASSVTVTLLIVAISLSALATSPNVAAMAWSLTAAMPFVLLREFGRRHAFAHLRTLHALVQDVVVSTLQIGALAWLFQTGRMTAATATLALGVACLVTTLGWLIHARRDLSFCRGKLRASVARSWHLGKWLVGSRLSANIQGYFSYWLTTAFFGPAVTGVYAACMNIVSFSNPLVYGVSNVLTPRAALVWKQGGESALWKIAVREALLLGVIAGAFCLLVALAGDWAMRLLYDGAAFAGHRQTLVVLSLAMLALAISFPAASGLATMERSRAIFLVAAFTTASTLVLLVALVAKWGLIGAAYGYLAGNTITAIGRWAAFRRAIATGDSASLDAVLSNIEMDETAGKRSIIQLGDGDHATAFLISSTDGAAVWRGHTRIVIKVFKPEAGLNREATKMQFEAVAQLHHALDGFVANGWTISAAKPLAFNEMPLAIVMSAIRGKHFDHCDWQPESLKGAVRAFIVAMNQYWRLGQNHGDLGLQNVLFDRDERRIDFIDPGTLESCPSCHSSLKGRSPASIDLGHLLADLTRDLVHRRGTAAGRRRQQLFIEDALAVAVSDFGSSTERTEFLKELMSSVDVHLEDLASQARGLKRLWHRIVLPLKRRLARSILAKIATATSGLHTPADGAPDVPALSIAT